MGLYLMQPVKQRRWIKRARKQGCGIGIAPSSGSDGGTGDHGRYREYVDIIQFQRRNSLLNDARWPPDIGKSLV
jgi:hypothetical protein